MTKEFRAKDVFTTYSVMDSTDVITGVVSGLQSLQSAFFRPNVLFLDLSALTDENDVERWWTEARRPHIGVLLLANHPKASLPRRTIIHIWFEEPAVDRALSEGMRRAQRACSSETQAWKTPLPSRSEKNLRQLAAFWNPTV